MRREQPFELGLVDLRRGDGVLLVGLERAMQLGEEVAAAVEEEDVIVLDRLVLAATDDDLALPLEGRRRVPVPRARRLARLSYRPTSSRRTAPSIRPPNRNRSTATDLQGCRATSSSRELRNCHTCAETAQTGPFRAATPGRKTSFGSAPSSGRAARWTSC